MDPWFDPGLKFKCTGCGKCCTGEAGFVFLSPEDIERLSAHLQITTKEFVQKYTRIVNAQIALLDSKNAECIFLKENRCNVYEARPVQCRTFPWWLQNIRSPEAWAEAARDCEGINHSDAEITPSDKILEECQTDLDNVLKKNFTK